MKKNLNTIIFCSLCLTFTSCYQFFQSKIPMNSESSSTTLSDIFLEEPPVTSLNAPEQIFVSEYLYTDRIKISWTPVEGASSYRLERAVKSQQDNTIPSEEDFKTIPASKLNVVSSSFIYDTSFIDIILDSPSYISSEYGNVYYYRVRAENSSKGYEPSSFIISQNGAALFAPCTTITASAGESTEEIKIEWKKTLNASMYKIYRSRNSQGSNSELLAKVKANITSYTDFITEADQGTDFYYSIEAENFLGNTSVISPLALGYTLVKGAPTRVTGVITTEGKSRGDTNNSITIQWNKVEFDTDNYNGFYSIYRSSSTDPSLTLVKSVPSTDAETETFTNDKGLKPNTYYYYRVMAYAEKIEKDSDESKNLIKGPISNSSAEDFDPETKKTAACEGFIISAPPFVAVNNLGDLNEITFSAPIGEKGYSEDSGLYDDYKNFTYKIFAGNETDNVTTELSAVPSEAENGMYTVTVEKYKYYKIQTASEDGSLTSGFSSIVAQSPSCVTNVIATRAANPADWEINTPNSNEIYPVKITWAGPAEGADGGFHIYRSTSPDSGFRKITEEPVTGFEYIDKNESAKAGSYYYYKVLSLNILGSGSNYSETVM